MNRALVVSVACLLVACGGPDQPTPEPNDHAPNATYDLHEWGVLTVSPGVVELAAGPGRQAPPTFDPNMVVEKPVIYVHASAPLRFALEVRLGAGYALAERWPGTGAPISWNVDANPRSCTRGSAYPTSCASADGYCEVVELADYEADDASCLTHGDDTASLLFYRLRAEPSVAGTLPVTIEQRHPSTRATRTAWRVRRGAGGAHAWRLQLGTQAADLPESSPQSAPAAAAWMHRELERRGLTDAERAAFERAWWSTFFGMDVSVEQTERAVEETPAVVEETLQEDITPASDVLLYFLEDAEIAAIARLDATPAPRHVRRAFVVRHLL